MTDQLGLLPALKILLTEKNISKAAEKLQLSQPATSRLFAKLKRSFADPLMVRSGTQYQLTPRGKTLLQQLNQLLPQLETLWQSEQLGLAEVSQTCVLAGTDMDIVFVSQKLQRIQQQAPNLTLAIRTSTPRIFDQLIDGEIDLLLTAFESEQTGLYRKQLTEENFVVIAGEASHYHSDNLDLAAYLAARHGKFAFAEPTRGKVDLALAQMGKSRQVRLTLPTFLQIPAFLDDPDLLFSVPRSFAEYLAKQFAIKVLPMPFTVQPLPIYLYWHERLHHSPLHQWIRQQLVGDPKR